MGQLLRKCLWTTKNTNTRESEKDRSMIRKLNTGAFLYRDRKKEVLS